MKVLRNLKQSYYNNKKKISSPSAIHLTAKIKYGGSVGSFAMAQLGMRDWEENGALYKEAKAERDALRQKRNSTCALCKKWFLSRGFKICYSCHLKKRIENI